MPRAITIHLIERGSAHVVSAQDWLSAGCEWETRELVKRGVIKVTFSQNHVLVEPKTLVGTFISPGLKLHVAPKIGDLSSFVISILKDWRKNIAQDVPDKKGVSLGETSPWRTFEMLLKNLLSEGLPWKYSTVVEETSTPMGRILFRDTLTKLHSRGISHRVISKRQVREYYLDLPLCLDAVRRRLSAVDPLAREEKYCVQRLIDTVGERANIIPEADAFILLEQFLNMPDRPHLGKIAHFCREILEGREEYKISERIGSGIAEFVDMEKLWEHAVHMLIQISIRDTDLDVAMHPLRASNIHLFDNGGPKLDPDLIVFNQGKNLAIVDAKYSIASSPSSGDVYQIASYCNRLQATMGLLAYVSDNDKSRISKIGCLDNGAPLFACYLSLDAFDMGSNFIANTFSSSIATV